MKLDVATLNCEYSDVDPLKPVEAAVKLFPHTWDDINYLGDFLSYYDRKFFVNGEPCPAFEKKKLIKRLKKIKREPPLLGITSYLVYQETYFVQNARYKIIRQTVHEYMDEVGFISLFELKIDESKVIAHALGHNRKLSHHKVPKDLMYQDLIRESNVPVLFCPECTYKLMLIRDI